MCSACLSRHPSPTGRNCPFVTKKKHSGVDIPESLDEPFHSPVISRVDRLLSGLHVSELFKDGEDMKGDEAGGGDGGTPSPNTALLDIVRLQQEQERALTVSMEKTSTNMSQIAKKVSKNRKSSKSLQPAVFLDTSGTSSDSDAEDLEHRPSLASPAVGVPEFRNESKRHKFSLKAYLPKTVSKPVTFAMLLSALLALVLAVSTAGYAITGMLDHLRFLADKAAAKSHTTESLIAYDEDVRRLAEHEGLSAFSYGHQSFINKNLGADSSLSRLAKIRKARVSILLHQHLIQYTRL